MSLIEAVILGIVQGITEFLPISSDGHLALGAQLMGREPDLTFVVFLHGATLLAMLAYFRSDIVRLLAALLPRNRATAAGDRRLVFLIVVGTVVTGVVALALEPVVEPMSADPTWVAIWFLGTAFTLALGEYLSGRVARIPTPERLTVPRTLFIGLMQGFAVLPGLSRSGTTIASGMLSGLSRQDAARFSFLMGIPIITVAALKDFAEILAGSAVLPEFGVALAGFTAAGVSGYLAISALLKMVRNTPLYGFAVYTALLGAILLITTIR